MLWNAYSYGKIKTTRKYYLYTRPITKPITHDQFKHLVFIFWSYNTTAGPTFCKLLLSYFVLGKYIQVTLVVQYYQKVIPLQVFIFDPNLFVVATKMGL